MYQDTLIIARLQSKKTDFWARLSADPLTTARGRGASAEQVRTRCGELSEQVRTSCGVKAEQVRGGAQRRSVCALHTLRGERVATFAEFAES